MQVSGVKRVLVLCQVFAAWVVSAFFNGVRRSVIWLTAMFFFAASSTTFAQFGAPTPPSSDTQQAVGQPLGDLETHDPSAFFDPGSGPGGGGSISSEVSVFVDAIERQNVTERLQALGDDLMGDSIDLNTGSVSFQHVDVSLPGNSGLEVAIRRTREAGFRYPHIDAASRAAIKGFYGTTSSNNPAVSSPLGDWTLETPRISLLMAVRISKYGKVTRPDPMNFCQSNSLIGAIFPTPIHIIERVRGLGSKDELGDLIVVEPDVISNDMDLHIPGSSSQKLLRKKDGVNWPAGTVRVTKDHWTAKCGPADHGTNSGLIVTAPNGTTYKFDTFKFRHATASPMSGRSSYDGGVDVWEAAQPRVEANLLASEVMDVNGNWVNYEYNARGWLTRIHSNDGREIKLIYDTAGTSITHVTANGRVWKYNYASNASGNIKLTKVTLPDNRYWDLQGFNLPVGVNASGGEGCTLPDQSTYMVHPSGTKGTFTFSETEHAYGYMIGGGETQVCRAKRGKLERRGVYDVMSIKTKTLEGKSYPRASWHYDYSGNYSNETRATKWGQMTNPLGEKMRTIYHHNDNKSLEGAAKRSEYRDASNRLMRSVDYSYVYEPAVSTSFLERTENTDKYTMPRHQIKTVTKQDGDTFTSESRFNTSQGSAAYSYGNPIQTKSYSNVSTSPRITDTTYEHNRAKWILGLPKRVVQNGREMATYTYDSLGRKTAQTRYGKPYATFGYHGAAAYKGALYWVKDAIGRQTFALQYKNGTPQQIKRPDGLSEYQWVDNNGWLTSQKDALGRTTRYRHDNMGRLTQIDPHGSWANTNITYNFSGGGAVQTITKGGAKTTVTYDGMYRTVLERTQDLSSGWQSYVNTKYDALGRVVFSSQPSLSTRETKGVTSKYDGLGRILESRETVAPYATTRYEYLNSHRRRVRDPSGADKMYYSYGYNGPGNDEYRAIYESVPGTWLRYTNIYKNIWGQTTQIRQREPGGTGDIRQNFYYDNQQRLCRHYVPEHGATKYQYNAAGEMTAYAKGQSNSGCGAVPSVAAKVSLTYDNLGRVTKTDFAHSGTPDITRSYDAVGNVKSVKRGGVDWSYGYNDADLLTSEVLKIDGRSFPMTYSYNTQGHMTRRTLPRGRPLEFAPDGLGRPTQATGSGHNYATNITYHINGDIASMQYYNGYKFARTLNNRLLPSRLLSQKGDVKAIDLNYQYDPRGKITQITDGAVRGHNRSYSYDGLGQLTAARGPWGAGGAQVDGTFTYDSLGNLRSKTLGNRKVSLAYDGRNRVTRSVDTGAPNGQGTGTRTLGYDSRGNVTTLGSMAFVYDYAGQPVTVSGSANLSGQAGVNGARGATNGNYTYDGNLKRVKSVVNGKTIYNIYDASGTLVHVHDVSANQQTSYVSVNGMTVARIGNNFIPSYVHNDHQGSPRMMSSNSGAALGGSVYTPFGEDWQVAAPPDQAGYTGHIRDSATGLNYMQARYYDPVIGRFLSVDPVGFLDTGNPAMFNRYSYAYNDPVNLIDLNGLAACPVDDKNCIDDPATETGDEAQPGPSEEQQEIDEIVVTAQIQRRFTDNTKIRFPRSKNSDLEQGFRVGPNGIFEESFSRSGIQNCDDGSSRAANSISIAGLGANQSIGHTHGGGGLNPLPGPEDGVAAAATGRTAYQMSRRGSFAIERTAIGFRVRQIGGRSLSRGERRAIQGLIAGFNQNNGGSGKKCTFTPN